MKCWDSRALFKSTSPSPTKKKKRESFCLCILTGDVLSLMKPTFSLYNPRCMCPLHMERPGAIASGLDCQALSAEAGSQASVCVWDLPAQSWELNSGHLAVSFPRGFCNLPPFLFAFVGSFLGSLLSPEARPRPRGDQVVLLDGVLFLRERGCRCASGGFSEFTV